MAPVSFRPPPPFVPEMLPDPQGRSFWPHVFGAALFFLDAHHSGAWATAFNASGAHTSQPRQPHQTASASDTDSEWSRWANVPLLRELDAVLSFPHAARSVVMVNQARLDILSLQLLTCAAFHMIDFFGLFCAGCCPVITPSTHPSASFSGLCVAFCLRFKLPSRRMFSSSTPPFFTH